MKVQAAGFLFLCLAAPSPCADAVWAAVPSNPLAPIAGVPEGNLRSTSGEVRFVPQRNAGAEAAPAPRRVLSVVLDEVAGAASKPASGPAAEPQDIPEEAFWPDGRDRIVAGAPRAGVQAASNPRNPWELRARPTGATEMVLAWGGVIVPDSGVPVAFLNGTVVRRGDLIGGFSVARVSTAAVVLERAGLFFVVPRGRRVTVVQEG